jgi:RNA polymerase sigma-70 factor (ECF subfamily)
VTIRSDREIVKAVLNGDRERYALLVQRYERAAFCVAYRVLGDFHGAQDVAQDGFLKAYRTLRNLRKPEKYLSWLLRIVRNRALDVLRKREWEISNAREDLPERGDCLARDERERELLDEVLMLPEQERRVVILRYFKGLSVAESAQVTGTSVGTVSKQLSRAYQRLRRRLGGNET